MLGNFYTGSPLDRLALAREDEAAILDLLLREPASRFVPVWRDQHLFAGGLEASRRPVVAMPERTAFEVPDEVLSGLPWALLGRDERGPVFALDLGHLEDPGTVLPRMAARFEPLRPLAPSLDAAEAAILAQARGLLHWRRNTRFCGHCGGVPLPEQGGVRMSCPQCGLQHFPRTDPVVIMLVQHQGRALLARGTRFPGRRLFSALAGFIEPGESAEEAVAREVFEETGVRVGEVRYHSSQPWPYPNSLMLGFLAEAQESLLSLDPNEIAEAQWLTPAQLRDPASLEIELPGPTAIARRLIDTWLETQAR